MKFIRAVLLIAIVSLVMSALIYIVTPDTIQNSWIDKIGEIVTVTLIIFIFLMLVYIIAATVIKRAMSGRKKSLPNQEGPKI